MCDLAFEKEGLAFNEEMLLVLVLTLVSWNDVCHWPELKHSMKEYTIQYT